MEETLDLQEVVESLAAAEILALYKLSAARRYVHKMLPVFTYAVLLESQVVVRSQLEPND